MIYKSRPVLCQCNEDYLIDVQSNRQYLYDIESIEWWNYSKTLTSINYYFYTDSKSRTFQYHRINLKEFSCDFQDIVSPPARIPINWLPRE